MHILWLDPNLNPNLILDSDPSESLGFVRIRIPIRNTGRLPNLFSSGYTQSLEVRAMHRFWKPHFHVVLSPCGSGALEKMF
jgi:hypothetical protein